MQVNTRQGRGSPNGHRFRTTGASAMRELAAHLGFHTRLDPRDASLYLHELELQSPVTPPL